MKQGNLFSRSREVSKNLRETPLAYRARPQSWDDFFGQKHLFKRYPFLMTGRFGSLILWGPPGVGKTTLAYLLVGSSKRELYPFSAVTGTLASLRTLMERAVEVKQGFGQKVVVFIDEIHRFNKIQQDALLPYVENGSFTLIGATTQNPRGVINRALLSRVQTVELKRPDFDELFAILSKVRKRFKLTVDDHILNYIAEYAQGDVRTALNVLEAACFGGQDISLDNVRAYLLENNRDYDKTEDRHYDVISAFIKSLRGSSPDAALLWLAVMLDGGEDPVFIARRLVIFASEDVGNADPQALPLAIACLHAVERIGMPESRINLAQGVTYLASASKSNASYKGINEALAYVREHPTIEVPGHLKNKGNEKGLYKYPHDYPQGVVSQEYAPKGIPRFYCPKEQD